MYHAIAHANDTRNLQIAIRARNVSIFMISSLTLLFHAQIMPQLTKKHAMNNLLKIKP